MAMDVNSYFDYGTADRAADNSLAEAYQTFVVLQANGQFAVATTPADSTVFGVLRDNVSEGEVPPVRTGSVAYVFAGGTVAAGDFITNDATGRAVVAQSGEAALGQVLETGGEAGDEVKIKLFLSAQTVA